MDHEAGGFKVNYGIRALCLSLALTKSPCRAGAFQDIAPKLRSEKCDAGNLASFSHLHKNYTVCRLGIHF
jgi:hypothetical protein